MLSGHHVPGFGGDDRGNIATGYRGMSCRGQTTNCFTRGDLDRAEYGCPPSSFRQGKPLPLHPMGIGSRTGLAMAVRHAVACVAIFAQALLLFTPLVELRDAHAGPSTISAGAITPDAPSVAPQHERSRQHDATSCPACIAQSLHAQVAPGAPPPTCEIVECHALDLRSAVAASHGPSSAHRSRAPPSIS